MNAKRQRREGAAQLLHESRLSSNVKAGFHRFFPPWKKGLIDQSEGHLRHDICLCQHRRAALDEDIESGHARGFLSHVGIEYAAVRRGQVFI